MTAAQIAGAFSQPAPTPEHAVLWKLVAFAILAASTAVLMPRAHAHETAFEQHLHESGRTYTAVALARDVIRVLYTVPAAGLRARYPAAAGTDHPAAWSSTVEGGFTVRNVDVACPGSVVDAVDYDAMGAFQYTLEFLCADPLDHVVVVYTLFAADPAHANLTEVLLGPHLLQMTLDRGIDRVEVPVAQLVWERGESWLPPETPAEFAGEKPTLARYFDLGFGHVLDGYDHLAFVLGLVLMVRRFRNLAITITAFTVAHSVTLGLSAADLVFVSAAWTEPLIALSILYVGAENVAVLWRRWRRQAPPDDDGPSLRWFVAFVFGLAHGFGFSYLLRMIGLPEDEFLLSLATFNIGVEVAQLAVVALPFMVLSRLNGRPHTVCAGIGSLAVAVVGTWWLTERLLA